MKNQKNERGITLVALVVTIVVLLILAGITIMYVMSDNGVFGKAQTAKSDTNKAVVREVIMSAFLEAQTEYFDPTTSANVADAAKVTTFVAPKISAAGITGTFTFTEFMTPPTETQTKTVTKASGELTYNGTPYTVTLDTTQEGASILTVE